jgi:hypothetical protein
MNSGRESFSVDVSLEGALVAISPYEENKIVSNISSNTIAEQRRHSPEFFSDV